MAVAATLLLWVWIQGAPADAPLELIPTKIVAGTEAEPKAVFWMRWKRDVPADTELDIVAGESSNLGTPHARAAGPRFLHSIPYPRPGVPLDVEVRIRSGGKSWVWRVSAPPPDLGWTMHLIPGFHFDPVWWNTQANYVERGALLDSHQASGHVLMGEYLRKLAEEPSYKVALHQLPYLKTFLEAHPDREAELKGGIASGRIDLVGGTYNELSSTLVSAEAAARNAIYGAAFQRRVLGGAGTTFWQPDVFGHDPSFPTIMAQSGHVDGAFARGPFHQWGAPAAEVNFPSEFLWMAPDGTSILTHYMTGHYGVAYEKLASGSNRAEGVGSRTNAILAELFEDLSRNALTHHVMAPMHMDFVRPMSNLADVVKAWNDSYRSPKLAIATPKEFFDGVRAEIAARGITPPAITRDMNPIFTGCQVSFADLKTANRLCENAIREAEIWATIAAIEGAQYPSLGLDRAWRQLLFNAHHDGITGSSSDQVYLDLLANYRDAFDIAVRVRNRALQYLRGRVSAPPTETFSWNATSHARSVSDPSTRSAGSIPALGYSAEALRKPPEKTCRLDPKNERRIELENERFRITIDLDRAGDLTSLVDKKVGKELLRGRGNDVVLLGEYPVLPGQGEGPWHLAPNGTRDDGRRATARPVGFEDHAVTIEATYPEFTKRQRIELLPGSENIGFATEIRNWTGRNQCLRVEFPFDLRGARPVFQTAAAVIGRPFARDVDTKKDPWTLDNVAHAWAGLGSVCTLEVEDQGKTVHRVPLAVGEIVVRKGGDGAANRVAEALARCGVTTTITSAGARRYGDLAFDSNVPDFCIWISGHSSPANPAPTLVNLGDSIAAIELEPHSIDAVVSGLEKRHRIVVSERDAHPPLRRIVEDYTVALVNDGPASMHITEDGRLGLNLLRSNTSWPAGVWIDPPARRLPDGAPLETMHGSHRFRYSLVAGKGDYRALEIPRIAEEIATPPRGSANGAASGPLLATSLSFFEVSPPTIQLAALKPWGFPEADWFTTSRLQNPRTVVMRLWNGAGRAVDATVRSHYKIMAANLGNLLEDRGAAIPVEKGEVRIPMGPHAFTTILLDLDAPVGSPSGPSIDPTDGDVSVSAYWLENLGEGVTGNGAVSILPWRREAPLGAKTSFMGVRLVNHRRDRAVKLALETTGPERFRCEIEPREVDLKPNETRDAELRITRLREIMDEAPAYVEIRGTLDDGHRITSGVWTAAYADTLKAERISITNDRRIMTRGGAVAIANRTDGRIEGVAAILTPVFGWWDMPHGRHDVAIDGNGASEVKIERVGLPFSPGSLDSGPTTFAIPRFAVGGRVFHGPPILATHDEAAVLLSFIGDRVRLRPEEANDVEVVARSRAPFEEGEFLRLEVPDGWESKPREVLVTKEDDGGWLRRQRFRVTPRGGAVSGELLAFGIRDGRAVAAFTVAPRQSALAKLDAVKVDGDLSEWDPSEFTNAKNPIGSARAAVRWGAAGLALAVEVDDDQHFQAEQGATIWKGDSIQIALSPAPTTITGYNTKDLEFGAALGPAGPVAWCWYGGDGGRTGRLEVPVAVVRRGSKTIYELLLPKETLPRIPLEPGSILGFSYIANDNDGAGYRGAVEWTAGMTGTKDSSLFGELLLRKE